MDKPYEIIKLLPSDYYKCGNIWDMEKYADKAAKWLKEIELGVREVYIYAENGEFIGEAAIVYQNSDPDYTVKGRRIYLSRMVVKSEHRNKGIGGILLDFLIERVKSLGYSEFALGVDMPVLNARHLYDKKGFTEVIYEGEDEVGRYQKLLMRLPQPKVIFMDEEEIKRQYENVKFPYAIIFAAYQGKLILAKHKNRDTFEVPGGHIEEGESPLEAAKRELFEETGSVEFDIKLVSSCIVLDEQGEDMGGGFIYYADVSKLANLPDSEMERVEFFESLPHNNILTYPKIQPQMFSYIEEWLRKSDKGALIKDEEAL